MGAIGQTVVDFGAHPGASQASVTIVDASILATSMVEAWVGSATADHSADEHMLEKLKVAAGSAAVGQGFNIYAEGESDANGGQLTGKWALNYVWN